MWARARFGVVIDLLEVSAGHVLEGNVDARLCFERPHKSDHGRVHKQVQHPHLRTRNQRYVDVRGRSEIRGTQTSGAGPKPHNSGW